MQRIAKLYAIKWQVQTLSAPLLEEFRRWAALTLHLKNVKLLIDNNAVESAMRLIALGRKNLLFVGSKTAGEPTAYLMSLIE